VIYFWRRPAPSRFEQKPTKRRLRARGRRFERLESRAMLSVNGDFNGDGFDDLAVGAPNDTVNGVNECGAVNVIYGSADGLVHAGNQFWHQGVAGVNGVPGAEDHFGFKLAVGDFDGDGFSDLAIGVPGKTVAGFAEAGAVNILYGSAAGLTASGDQQWNQDSSGINDSAQAGDGFGAGLAVGDFDGDGRDDLAIGAYTEDIGDADNAGMVHVLFGTTSGLTNKNDQTWHQDTPGINGAASQEDLFGFALAVGDFDDDGRDDLAIGASRETIGAAVQAGMVNVIYGSANGLAASGDQTWHQDSPGINDVAEASDLFGVALAVGDFNNDGHDDLAIGAPGETVSGFNAAGKVHIIYGSNSGLTGSGDIDWDQDSSEGIFDESEETDFFGFALAAGDVNGDGFDDLAVGVPFEDIDGADNVGAVNMLYGSAAGISSNEDRLWHQGTTNVPGASEDDDLFGMALGVGDYDGDGRADLVVGIPSEDVVALNDGGGAILLLYGHGLIDLLTPIWHQNLLDADNDVGTEDNFGASLG
jgi:hypothetical protein